MKEEKEEVRKPQYDGLTVRFIDVTLQGILCSSAAITDGTMTINGKWMDSATDL